MIARYAVLLAAAACAFPATQASAGSVPEGYKLEQVLMLSRHNLRAPLANSGSALAKVTEKKWPEWEVPGGNLTVKGGILETYMGRSIGGWLAENGLVPKDACPASGSVHIYANSLQRTVATAQFFVAGAFAGCDVAVHHQDKMGTMDPTFNPAIRDNQDGFRDQAVAAMAEKAKATPLALGYRLLDGILGFKASQSCTQDKLCDLTKGEDSFTAKAGEEPGTKGPLKLGNAVVDAFTLQYYEGFPSGDVAWGKIRNEGQWRSLAAIKNGYQEALFTSPAVARDVAGPMLAYIAGALVKPEAGKAVPVTVLFGHDSNVASVLAALEAEPYALPGQDEKTPIGGVIQFQRWRDTKGNRDLFRLDYVYQTKEQLRQGTKLTPKNPPRRVTLKLKGCPADKDGFCAWSDFAKTMP
ncbi:bifunctional glucose-1-phosphatase/inositol phosphatase [Labrys portucalensis]|uniref:Bifunctional glucose-1-phosphatase/inositol phosphatase n=1 Tax=Labrys neptuniae TaxID=376174 RepID=A0ABV6Z742_9HYPH